MLGWRVVLVWVLLALAIAGSWRVSAVGHALDVSFPGDIDLGVLGIGDNRSEVQVIFVQSDVGYRVYVRADRDRLGLWDQRFMSYIAGREMTEPLIVVSEEGAIPVGMTDALIAHRPGPLPSAEVDFWFDQHVSFDDTPAFAGRVYRILLTYTVVQDV